MISTTALGMTLVRVLWCIGTLAGAFLFLQAGQSTKDARSLKQAEIIRSMATSDPGVVKLGTNVYSGYVHMDGKPRWGPFRRAAREAAADSTAMKNHLKQSPGDLDSVLHRLYASSVAAVGGAGGAGAGAGVGVGRDDGCSSSSSRTSSSGGGGGGGGGGGAAAQAVEAPAEAKRPAAGAAAEVAPASPGTAAPVAAAVKPPAPKATVAPKAEVSDAHAAFDFFD